MSHGIAYTPGSGGALYAYDIATGGAYPTTGGVPGGVILVSATSSTVPTPVTAANGLYVQPATSSTWAVTGTFFQATQPVSLASVPSHAVTNAGTFATQSTQAGTWTVQPGNTANTTAWLVTGTGGTFPVTDSGGSLTVDAPATTPVFVRLSTGSAAIDTIPVTLATTLDATNDSVRSRVISGVLDDGSGVALTVKSAAGTASSSGVNAAITAVTSKKIRVLSYSLQAANANGSSVAANWQDDAGTPVVLSQTWDLAAREGISKPLSPGPGFYFQTTSGQALKLNLGSALSVRWELVYVEA